MTPRTKAVIRKIAKVFSWLLIVGGVCSIAFGIYVQDILDKTYRIQPLQMEADLSKAGEYTGTWNQTHDSHFGATIRLVLDREQGDAELDSVRGLLEGLRARVRFEDAEGSVVAEAEIKTPDMSSAELRSSSDFVELCYIAHGEEPEKRVYEVLLNVESPAEGLRDVKHRLEGSFTICGLEYVPALIPMTLGAISTVAGLLLAIILYVVNRHRRRRALRA